MGHGNCILLMTLALSLLCAMGVAEDAKKHVDGFLKANCYHCHGADVRKVGLRLDQYGANFLEGKNADAWKEVIDMINLGEMPPAGEP